MMGDESQFMPAISIRQFIYIHNQTSRKERKKKDRKLMEI